MPRSQADHLRPNSSPTGTVAPAQFDAYRFGQKNDSRADVYFRDVGCGTGQPLSDSAMQALWLRRVQTKPADFLKAKFAYQLATGDQKGGEK
ncbi:MAG: hypothetical protein ABGZ53_25045 [Fuerstiella sp.]|nr:hypothetical protein [Fuerstiella sp.]